MKKKIDFLIMYEVTTRELESIVLLGNELKNRGYSVEYFSFEYANLKKYFQNKKEIKKYYNNVEIVLMPSLYHDKEVYYLVHYVCGKCRNIVNLRWEQVFTIKNENNLDCYHYPHGDARKAYHMCWGQEIYNNMMKAGVDSSKLLLSGPIHMDFLREEFDNYYLEKENLYNSYELPLDKKCVLYISSFAIASFSAQQVKREEENAGQALFGDAVSRQQITRAKTLEWIEELLKKDSCTFIYRPHPVENVLGDLKELEAKYSNFRVISDYSVKQWILCSDVVTTWMSTSIAEAYFAKKSCLILRPDPLEGDNEVCLYKDAKLIDNKEDFLAAVNKEVELSISEDVLRSYYDVDVIPSYIRFSDQLEKVYMDRDNVFPWDEAKIAEFNSKKWYFALQSVLVFIYIPIIECMGKLREKYGVSWGKMNRRVDSYMKAQSTKHIKLATETTINNISEQIKKCVK